jgi:HSP20 family protein
MPDQAAMQAQTSQRERDATVAASQGQPAGRSDVPNLIPPADIFETKAAVILLLDVPGADPGAVEVTLDKKRLTIRAPARQTQPPQGYSCVYAEYQPGNYVRGFTLAGEIDGDRIEAALHDGVLRLTLPKASPSEPKKINVKAS